jgi:uncharacterized protein involved in type VI secretion and phage assembly
MTLFPEFAWQERPRRQQFTIALAEVVNTVDSTGNARVQIELPWLPGTQPWARVAVPGAGSNRGMYMLPHEGDEVLVAFNRNDVSDCYVVGSLWSTADTPPLSAPLDPTTKILIRTEAGHEIQLDDVANSITVTTATGHQVELAPGAVTLATAKDTASIKLDQAGDVTISATKSITLKAKEIKVEGTGKVELESSGSVTVNGGTTCKVKATTILLN